jgi:hypothetical protein
VPQLLGAGAGGYQPGLGFSPPRVRVRGEFDLPRRREHPVFEPWSGSNPPLLRTRGESTSLLKANTPAVRPFRFLSEGRLPTCLLHLPGGYPRGFRSAEVFSLFCTPNVGGTPEFSIPKADQPLTRKYVQRSRSMLGSLKWSRDQNGSAALVFLPKPAGWDTSVTNMRARSSAAQIGCRLSAFARAATVARSLDTGLIFKGLAVADAQGR